VYEHGTYSSGYRFKNRALGHSLDSDSGLFSVVAQYQDSNAWEYTVKYHNANINIDSDGKNTLSLVRKDISIFEASIQGDVWLGNLKLDVSYSSDGIPATGEKGSFVDVGINWVIKY